MDALQALHNRTSVPKLSGPAPDEECLNNIYQAAFRAADHGVMRPWRFLVVKDESRDKLGDLFVSATLSKNPAIEPAALNRIRQKPQRAPVIIVTISSYREHPKVPQLEQDMSAAAATQNMLLAAFAQGIGAFWRTGLMAYDPIVTEGLGLKYNEKIISFLYLGQISGATKNLNTPEISDYFQHW
jgi:nitroreductase